MSALSMILFVILSTYVIFKASYSFDIAASFLTRNMASGIKGPTINAVASSLPELLISFLFLFHYNDLLGFSAGYAAIIGSAAFNICIIPCIAASTFFYFNDKDSIKLDSTIIIQDPCSMYVDYYFRIYILDLSHIKCFNLNNYIHFYIYSVLNYRKTDEVNSYQIVNLKESSLLKSILSLEIFYFLGIK